jgi:uncharacterized repeat protein (TIGR01451 family)
VAVNTANVEGAALDTNQTNNVSTATTTVTGTATAGATDLSIVKTGTPATIATGGTETYTLVVGNGGATAATGVTVTDLLPAGATAVSTSGSGATFTTAGGVVTATIANLAAGASDTLTITATLNVPGTSVNTANVESAALDTNQSNNNSTATTTVTSTAVISSPDLSIVKTGTPATITVGGTETYTLVIDNGGATPMPVTNVTVTDTLPAGATVLSTTGPGASFTTAGGVVTATIASLAANATETLTITASLNTAGAAVNTANVEAAEPDTNQTNNNSTATTTVTSTASASGTPNLTITKAGPATDAAGQSFTYTIVVTNSGGAAATGAIVTDRLPAGLTNITATDPAGTVVVSGNTVTDTLGSVAASSGFETITITATPGGTLNGTSIVNTATLNFNATTQQSNAVTTAIGTVAPPPPSGHVCYLAGVPGDGTAATFIQNLYRELLGREPDSASLPFWLNYVQNHDNEAGHYQVVQAFFNTPEYKSHYITCLYEAFLGRAPDAGGLQFWTEKMGAPGTPGKNTGSADEKFVLAAIVGSDEFYLDSGSTPQGFINGLYHDLLGRAPDAGGMAYWVQQSQIRDRDGIVRDFLTTPESAHLVLDSFYPAPGGTASHPLAAPGTPAGTGGTPLAEVLGGGWENLYFDGPFNDFEEANDPIFSALAKEGVFAALEGGAPWDDVELLMLVSPQYYNNPNRPVTR